MAKLVCPICKKEYTPLTPQQQAWCKGTEKSTVGHKITRMKESK